MANEGSGAQAAIVFADVSGSTQLYVQLGDNTARNVIAKALDYLSAVTVENGGVVIKTIGDEVMCRFPSADQGFDAASEMQRRLKENAANISQQVRIAIRVGLQWGEVVEQADGDVFGDAVNIAARVAAIAKRDQIVTTELTVQALTGARPTSTRPFDRVALKGRVGLRRPKHAAIHRRQGAYPGALAGMQHAVGDHFRLAAARARPDASGAFHSGGREHQRYLYPPGWAGIRRARSLYQARGVPPAGRGRFQSRTVLQRGRRKTGAVFAREELG